MAHIEFFVLEFAIVTAGLTLWAIVIAFVWMVKAIFKRLKSR